MAPTRSPGPTRCALPGKRFPWPQDIRRTSVMPETTLLTGADGYLGGNLAREILANSDQHLVLAVKGAAGDEGFADKCRRLDHELGPIGRGRMKIVPADLRRPD